jgi:flagellar M-ring protein FliF
MGQIGNLIANLSLKQRISLLAAAAVVFGALFGLSRWNKERDFRPLFTNLAAEDAGALLARLRETNVDYRLSEDGSIVLVPSAKVAEVRLQMAAAGLPKTGRIGFELFDRNNFGATDFAEQVNYHRAVEGELERSIMSLSEVELARVHITFPKDSVFVESRQPAKASVMVKLRLGARLAPQNVLAVCHLVASAVDGLLPEAVSVLDMNGNLLNRPRRASLDGAAPSEAAIEYRQSIEKDLLAKIQGTLEPLLGPDKFRAGVYVDCDFTSSEQSEEVLDPSRSVMLTSMRAEEGSGLALASGVPGTASNLPRPASRPGTGSGGISRQTENVTYQTSRTVKRVRMPQGTIRRISASLLIDHTLRWEGTGANMKRITQPPPAERIKSIRDLVAAAIGLSAERGDQLIVESLPFESTLTAEPFRPQPAAPPAPAPAIPLPEWLQKLIGQKPTGVLIGVAAGVLLALVVGIAVLLRKALKKKVSASVPRGIAAGSAETPEIQPSEDAIGRQMESALAERMAIKDRQNAEALRELRIQPVVTKKTEVLTKHIVEETKKDPMRMAYIVRSWLNESER